MFFDNGAQDLSEVECQALLATADVGRLSLTIRALPVVLPVNYGYLGGNVILAIGDGPAQRAMSLGNIIGLGVDNAHMDEPFWTVLVIGRSDDITDPTACAEYARFGLTAQTYSASGESHYSQLTPTLMTGDRAA